MTPSGAPSPDGKIGAARDALTEALQDARAQGMRQRFGDLRFRGFLAAQCGPHRTRFGEELACSTAPRPCRRRTSESLSPRLRDSPTVDRVSSGGPYGGGEVRTV